MARTAKYSAGKLPVMRGLFAVLLLFASGCLSADEGPPPPSSSQATRTATDPALPGVVLDAVLDSTGSRHVVAATARNQGSSTYYVSSICIPPWSEEIRDASGKRVWPEPRYYCAAFGRSAFKPGERLEARLYWNETVHDAERSESRNASPGSYDWSVSFGAARDAESGPESKVSVSFRIRVS